MLVSGFGSASPEAQQLQPRGCSATAGRYDQTDHIRYVASSSSPPPPPLSIYPSIHPSFYLSIYMYVYIYRYICFSLPPCFPQRRKKAAKQHSNKENPNFFSLIYYYHNHHQLFFGKLKRVLLYFIFQLLIDCYIRKN